MPYTKTNWVDRSVQYPNRFTRTTAGGFDTLTPAPGTITAAGTPITANALNNLENGVENVDQRLSTVEGKYVAGEQVGMRIEQYTGQFFTNGGSDNSTATITFGTAFATPPTVSPANMPVQAAYADAIRYPFIYNVTTTGFSVKISTQGSGMLGTVGSPVNLLLKFLVFGK